jgi:hypothetical protein
VRRVLAGLVDGDRVHLLAQEPLERPVPAGELRPLVAGERVGVDEPDAESSEEQVAQEPGPLPLGLARSLGHLAGTADLVAGVNGLGHDALARSACRPKGCGGLSIL